MIWHDVLFVVAVLAVPAAVFLWLCWRTPFPTDEQREERERYWQSGENEKENL